jgi:hypothetical protein
LLVIGSVLRLDQINREIKWIIKVRSRGIEKKTRIKRGVIGYDQIRYAEKHRIIKSISIRLREVEASILKWKLNSQIRNSKFKMEEWATNSLDVNWNHELI